MGARHIQDVARALIVASMEKLAMSPAAIARAIASAIEQPTDVDVGEIIVRPTEQAELPVRLTVAVGWRDRVAWRPRARSRRLKHRSRHHLPRFIVG